MNLVAPIVHDMDCGKGSLTNVTSQIATSHISQLQENKVTLTKNFFDMKKYSCQICSCPCYLQVFYEHGSFNIVHCIKPIACSGCLSSPYLSGSHFSHTPNFYRMITPSPCWSLK